VKENKMKNRKNTKKAKLNLEILELEAKKAPQRCEASNSPIGKTGAEC